MPEEKAYEQRDPEAVEFEKIGRHPREGKKDSTIFLFQVYNMNITN
jgi:hypothetical protein